tara:strand:+ start:2943 stop:3506 length:564 start_codon:yes stop_codon:yes gene_type:complete
MTITKEKLIELNACKDGYKYWLECNESDLVKFMRRCIKDEKYNWAMWLFYRVVEPRTRTRSCIYSASLVLHIFEENYPDDNRPRDAIKAARRWVNSPIEKNRRSATTAAGAAYDAADAAAYTAAAADAADTAAYTADSADNTAAANTAAADAADTAATAADKKELYIKIINHAIRLVKNGVKNEHNK